MKSSIDTTLAAKEAGLYTVFFTIDATRTELNRFLDIVDQVATEGHMDALTMADTMGVVHAGGRVSYVVKKVIERLKKPVEIHCHQDFGLGVANTRRGARRRRVGGAHDDHGPRRARRQRADGRRRHVAALPARHRPRHPARRSSARSRSS